MMHGSHGTRRVGRDLTDGTVISKPRRNAVLANTRGLRVQLCSSTILRKPKSKMAVTSAAFFVVRTAIRASSDAGTCGPEWFTVTRRDRPHSLRRSRRAIHFRQAFGWVIRPAVDTATISCRGGRRRVRSCRRGQDAGSCDNGKSDGCARNHACISQESVGSRFGRATPPKCDLPRDRQLAQQDQGNDGEHRNDPEHSAEIDRDIYIALHIGHSFWFR